MESHMSNEDTTSDKQKEIVVHFAGYPGVEQACDAIVEQYGGSPSGSGTFFDGGIAPTQCRVRGPSK